MATDCRLGETVRSPFRADLLSFVFLIIAVSMAWQVRAHTVAIHIDLPEQPMSESLASVGRQCHINVLFDPAEVRGRTGPALKLTASVHEVLAMLLAGSGLGYRFVDENTVAVSPIRESNATGPNAGQARGSSGADVIKFDRTAMSNTTPLRLTQTDSPLYAQSQVAGDAKTQPANEIGEIVVTARKMAEDIQTVPISMTELSGVDLQRMTVRNVGDIQYQVPNLVLEPSTSDSNSMTIAIRGQKQNDILPTVDPSVGIYIDDIYYPRTTGLTGALIDVDRVEVLRGPQGTLYGRNTTGGALNIFTKNPTDYLEGNASLTYGDYSTRIYSGMLNLPLSDNIAARIVANRELHDGYGSDYLGRPLADEDSYYTRAKLRGDFNGVEVVLYGIYQQNRSGGAIYKATTPFTGPGVPNSETNALEAAAELGLPFTPAGLTQASQYLNSFVGGNLYRTGGTSPPVSNFNSSVYGLDIKAPLTGDISLRSTTSYVFVDRRVDDSDGVPIYLNVQRYMTASRYIAQELQLQGGSPQFITWAAGLYAGDEAAYEYENIIVYQDINPDNPLIFAGNIHNRNQAAYAQANWQFAPKLRLTTGVRYSRDERELDADSMLGTVCAVPAPGVLITNTPSSPFNGPSQCPRPFGANFAKPSWLVSLDYQATDDIFTYIKSSYGYRSGGLNFRGTNTAVAFAPFQPETVLEYEAGTKLDFFDKRAQLNLAVFDDYYDNEQVTGTFDVGPLNLPTGITSNAGKAKIDGLEVELRLRPVRAFTLTVGSGLTAAHYVEFVDTLGNHRNEPFPVPRWTGNAAANYVLDTGFGHITTSLDYHYQTASTLNAGNTTYAQPGYGLVNGRLAFNVDRSDLEIAAYCRNLLNKAYIAQSGTLSTIGDPRTFGVTVTKYFGRRQ
jgi:iron complex outermembrane recepter protein